MKKNILKIALLLSTFTATINCSNQYSKNNTPNNYKNSPSGKFSTKNNINYNGKKISFNFYNNKNKKIASPKKNKIN